MPTALRIPAFGIDKLELTDITLSELGPRDVHVRFHAASLNYRDLMTVTGTYSPKMDLPRIPGSDAAGEVLAVGRDVTWFKPGDRVASLFFQDWKDGVIGLLTGKTALGGAIDGVFATERILPDTGITHIPDWLSFAQAATLPCAGVTAWNALVEKGNVSPGETVLVLGTGGVSLFALQIAKAAGARVILTSSSDEKLHRGRELGADETINYRQTPAWDQRVLELTGGRGADHIVEVGGAQTLPLSLAAAAPNAHVYIIGVLSGMQPGPDLTLVLRKSLHVDGVYVGSHRMFERLTAALTAGRIEPVIDRTFPLTGFREAFEHMQSGSHFGKIVLSLTS